MKRYFFAFCCFITALCARAEEAYTSSDKTHQLEFSARGAYVLPSNIIVRGFNRYDARTSSAFAANAEYSFRYAPSSLYGKYYPHAYQGIGIGYTGFHSDKITGNPVNIYVLQGSRIASLSPRLSLDYEWNFGISAGWKKITSDTPTDSYDIDGLGSHVNAYIDLGFKLNYALTDRLSLTAGVNFSHFSNGNTGYPNPGVNVLWARLGLLWKLGKQPPAARADWQDYRPHFSLDFTGYGAWRKHTFDYPLSSDGDESEERIIPGHFGVWGINVNPLWHFNPVIAVGPALDFQYDQGSNLNGNYAIESSPEDPKFYSMPVSDRMMAGLSARVELQMPIFSVNIGLGHSLFAARGNTMRGWYQTFTLKTAVTRNLYVSTGYRLERFSHPGNLMLGLGWRFDL